MTRALIAFAALASLGASPALAQSTAKVGMILSLTGQFADTGLQLGNGFDLYLKQHPPKAGAPRIEGLRKDDGGMHPDVAKRLAQEFVVRDKADALGGFDLTPNALAAADVSAEAKKFMVVMTAATSIITEKSPYLARTSFTTPMVSGALGQWASQNGIHGVYTLISDYGPGIDAVKAFDESFKDGGGKIVGEAKFPVDTIDFGSFIQAAKDSDPDAIFIFTPGGAQPAAIGKAIAERGIDTKKIKILSQDEMTGVSALRSMGDAAIGIITSSIYDYNLNTPANHEFVRQYQAAYHREPDIFSIGGYDGAQLIQKAIEKAGGKLDGESLINAAKGMKWDSPRGPVSIDPETRDIVENVYIRRVEKVDGKLVNVEFDKIANAKDPVKAKKASGAK